MSFFGDAILETTKILKLVASEKRKKLLETEAKIICNENNIPTPKFKLAKSLNEFQ